jgi:p-hydroxybenzoate 3-monooxygenase
VRRTQVGIVGAGPAGLLLSHLLHREGIESVVLESRTQEYVIARVRAGVLEQRAVDLFRSVGLGGRVDVEGLVHHGIELRFNGEGHRIALSELTGGRTITIYGQNRVVEDLIEGVSPPREPLRVETPSHDSTRARRSATATRVATKCSCAMSSPAATASTASAAPPSPPAR